MRILLGEFYEAFVEKYAPWFFGVNGSPPDVSVGLGEGSAIEARHISGGQFFVKCVDRWDVNYCLVECSRLAGKGDWFEVWDHVVGGGLTSAAVADDPAFDGRGLEVG